MVESSGDYINQQEEVLNHGSYSLDKTFVDYNSINYNNVKDNFLTMDGEVFFADGDEV